MKNQTSLYDTTIRLFFLFLIIGWCLMIMMPFVSVLLWSIILAMALFPLHKFLSSKMGNRPKLASSIIVLSIVLIVVVPTAILVTTLVEEVRDLKTMYSEGRLTIPAPHEKIKELPLVGTRLYDTWTAASLDIEKTIEKYKDQLTELGKTLVKGILGSLSAIIQIMISLVIAGILLVVPGVGEAIRKFFKKLAGDRGDEFADITTKTVGSVVKGILGVALILAFLHAIILILAGVPFAGIWTLLIFVLCVLQIPLLFVVIPIVAYIFSTHELPMAILWSALLFIAGMSDNILRPILLGISSPVPLIVIFIGVIGGFILSGFIGLFTGAIVMSIGYKLFIGWVNSPEVKEEV